MNVIESIKHRFYTYKSTPFYIDNKVKYGIWNVLRGNFNLSIWAKTKSGSNILLGKDKVDEYILEDLFSDSNIYNPSGINLYEGDIILDVGAHHGIYATEMAIKYKGVEILCIEPDPVAIKFIEKHKQKNRVNLTIIPFAIGNNCDSVYLTDNQDGSWGKTIEKDNNNESSIKVYQKTLHELLSGINTSKIKLVKSNCEGGEFALVEQLIMMNLRPDYLILMIHPDRGDKNHLIKILEEINYSAIPVYNSEINPCFHFILNK